MYDYREKVDLIIQGLLESKKKNVGNHGLIFLEIIIKQRYHNCKKTFKERLAF